MLTLNRTAKVKVNKIKALRAFLTYKLRFSTDPFLTIQGGNVNSESQCKGKSYWLIGVLNY